MPKKKEEAKPKKKAEPKGDVVTDILEEFFFDGDQEMIKRTFMAGSKKVDEEIVKSI